MSSHSDSEIVSVPLEEKLHSVKPKYTISYLDSVEPNDTKIRKSKRTKQKESINVTISMQPFETDDESDDTWYPPQHPVAKRRKKARKEKREQRKRKPKEERWSYWKK